MPAIQFDVLVPDAAASEVGDAFSRAIDILVRRQALTAGTVRHETNPRVDAMIYDQLSAVYAQEREEDPVEASAVMHRYVIEADGASSYNQLAMALSRILTPEANLPKDPAALEQELRFEQPSIYPWVVEILR